MRELASEEIELHGNWITGSGKSLIRDATEERIEWLTKEKLDHVVTDPSGWESLYRDPRDGRLWELTYPQNETHGGGPRRLRVISRQDAAIKYANATI